MTLIEILESRQEALNVAQVAELLGISEKKVYHLAATGELPSFRVGKAIRFDPQDLADWLRRKKPSRGAAWLQGKPREFRSKGTGSRSAGPRLAR